MSANLGAAFVSLWLGLAGAAHERLAPLFAEWSWPAGFSEAQYRPHLHDVTNWRWQTVLHLDATLGFKAVVLLGGTPAAVSRCVKLNNYWCIKRAGWNGEIAADAEGHVAFASAADGARTAAFLLRRYYVDFGHRSALAIVSHWAPAECGFRSARLRGLTTSAAGIGGTLRARWLAAHRRRGMPARTKLRRSAVPDRLAIMMPAPTIEAGVAEAPVRALDLDAFLPPRPAAPRLPGRAGMAACPGEAQRIGSYARQAVLGLSAGVDDDLHLFDTDGRSTPRLARLMANMAAVEIGPLKVRMPLIAEAVARTDAARLPR